MSTTSLQFFIRLAIIVIVWYLGLAYLPQIASTCLDGECGFSLGEIILSFTIPLAIIALSFILEMLLYRKALSPALSDIGLTRFNGAGIRSDLLAAPALFLSTAFTAHEYTIGDSAQLAVACPEYRPGQWFCRRNHDARIRVPAPA